MLNPARPIMDVASPVSATLGCVTIGVSCCSSSAIGEVGSAVNC